MRTNVYIDGFNLYYGAVKGTPYRWLDVAKLSRLLLPKSTINRIRYFTALVQSRPNNPQQGQRQQTYLRALQTIPNLTVHYGHFLSGPVRMLLTNPPVRGSRTVEVLKTEEKGSDVNLATFLLVDAFDQDYESAVIVSNDSDLALPIQFVQQKFGCPVGLLNPHRNPSQTLLKLATFYRPIRAGGAPCKPIPRDPLGCTGDDYQTTNVVIVRWFRVHGISSSDFGFIAAWRRAGRRGGG